MPEALRVALGRNESLIWNVDAWMGEPWEWIPLFEITAGGIWFGVARNGECVLGEPGSCVFPWNGGRHFIWVSVLNIELTQFRRNIQEASDRLNVSAESIHETVPYNGIVAMALKNPGDRWAAKAAEWVVGGVPFEPHLDLLRSLLKDRSASQKTRHGVWHLIKKFEQC